MTYFSMCQASRFSDWSLKLSSVASSTILSVREFITTLEINVHVRFHKRSSETYTFNIYYTYRERNSRISFIHQNKVNKTK
jgi:hypothetical protein